MALVYSISSGINTARNRNPRVFLNSKPLAPSMSDDDSGSDGNNPETEPTLDGQTISKGGDNPDSTRDSDE